MKLSKFQLAAIRRAAQTNLRTSNKIAKLKAQKEQLDLQIEELQASIEAFDAPIKPLIGDLNSVEFMEQYNSCKAQEAKEEVHEAFAL